MRFKGLIAILGVVTVLSGCSLAKANDLSTETTESTSTSDLIDIIGALSESSKDFRLDGDVRFVPVSTQTISGGDLSEVTLTTLVDLETGYSFVLTEQIDDKSGVDLTLLSTEIHPDLDALRSEYNYNTEE